MAVAGLARSLECALLSAWSPPRGETTVEEGHTGRMRWRGGAEGYSPKSTGSSRGTTAAASKTVGSNDWSSAVPLPRLALLSGLTTLRLNVSLAGIHARVTSVGLSPGRIDRGNHRGRLGGDQLLDVASIEVWDTTPTAEKLLVV